MEKRVLKNGLTVIFEHRPTKSVVISVSALVGSKDEQKSQLGISHFIEHMLFDGTKNRTSMQIASEIEAIGGELNAMTATEETFFYAKVLNKHFGEGLAILADIIQNPLFDKKEIENERKVIRDELTLTYDQPRFYQWVLFHKALFKGRLGNEPLGNKKTINAMTREKLLRFYSAHYTPANLIVTVVGSVKNPLHLVERAFSGFAKNGVRKPKKVERLRNRRGVKAESRPISQSYMVLGYQTPDRMHRDSFSLDIARSILGRGQSGRLFQEIRQKLGLAYEVGCHHDAAAGYGFFAVYVNTNRKNIGKVKRIILGEFIRLKKITKAELEEAKEQIEGEFILANEDNVKRAEQLGFSEQVKSAEEINRYIGKIKRVTVQDVRRAVGKYLNSKYTMAVLRQR